VFLHEGWLDGSEWAAHGRFHDWHDDGAMASLGGFWQSVQTAEGARSDRASSTREGIDAFR